MHIQIKMQNHLSKTGKKIAIQHALISCYHHTITKFNYAQ